MRKIWHHYGRFKTFFSQEFLNQMNNQAIIDFNTIEYSLKTPNAFLLKCALKN